jgi:hypothetical protein
VVKQNGRITKLNAKKVSKAIYTTGHTLSTGDVLELKVVNSRAVETKLYDGIRNIQPPPAGTEYHVLKYEGIGYEGKNASFVRATDADLTATGKPVVTAAGTEGVKGEYILRSQEAKGSTNFASNTSSKTPQRVEFNENGTFKVIDWKKYPQEGVPEPKSNMKLIYNEEYDIARDKTDVANDRIHRNDPHAKGKEIHEIHPVKFGGSPTDITNKVYLTPQQHRLYTAFWNNLREELEKYFISRK